MNKRIKHIITATLVISAFSAIVPASSMDLGKKLGIGTVGAYAYTYSSASNGELSSLNVYKGNGSSLELRNSYYGDEVNLTSKKDYYIELNGSDEIELEAEVEGDGYIVKVFTSGAKDAKAYDIDEPIHIDAAGTNVYLRTYESEDDFRDADDDEDVTKCKKTYVLHVKRKVTGTASDEELFGDEAALRSIYLSDGTIDFSKKKTEYNVNVGEDVDELIVRAKPENDSNTVEINEDVVNDEDNYEAVVELEKGSNVIEIKVTNDEEDYYNIYTLNVFRGKNANNTIYTTNENNENQIQASKWSFNSWQQVNGKWQYINGVGEPLKEKFRFDVNTNNTYYLDEDGYRVCGWGLINNKWYYFNELGEMQTGWLNKDGKWYYLNKGGIMVTGWNKISDKWYYLDDNGVMKTGWFQAYDGKWYFLNENGEMLSDTTVDGYNLDKNGVMV